MNKFTVTLHLETGGLVDVPTDGLNPQQLREKYEGKLCKIYSRIASREVSVRCDRVEIQNNNELYETVISSTNHIARLRLLLS